jgi:hypothetical protein
VKAQRTVVIFLLFFLLASCNPEKIFRNAPVIEQLSVQPEQVNPFDTVYASVTATNTEEGILSYKWSVSPEQGFFLDGTGGASTRWIAPTVGGDYTFKILVSNDYKSTERTAPVRVVEAGNPLVRILAPANDDYFVQRSSIDIQAEAFHNNGINRIQLFVKDLFISEQSGSSANSYQFSFAPDSSYLGKVEIKIAAIANFVFTVGADSVVVNIEGIVPRMNP